MKDVHPNWDKEKDRQVAHQIGESFSSNWQVCTRVSHSSLLKSKRTKERRFSSFNQRMSSSVLGYVTRLNKPEQTYSRSMASNDANQANHSIQPLEKFNFSSIYNLARWCLVDYLVINYDVWEHFKLVSQTNRMDCLLASSEEWWVLLITNSLPSFRATESNRIILMSSARCDAIYCFLILSKTCLPLVDSQLQSGISQASLSHLID